MAVPIAVAQVIMPHDSSTNNDRLSLYTQWLAALGISSAAVAPPVSATNSLRCGAGWADANAKCGNTDGSFVCTCRGGYSGNGVTCADVDECGVSRLHNCQSHATCTNTAGSFTCTCNPYSGSRK